MELGHALRASGRESSPAGAVPRKFTRHPCGNTTGPAEGGTLSTDEVAKLSTDEVAKLLRVTPQVVHKRRALGKLLGFESVRRGLRFPAWQFTNTDTLAPDGIAYRARQDPDHVCAALLERARPAITATTLDASSGACLAALLAELLDVYDFGLV